MLPIITFATHPYDPILTSTYKVVQSTDTLVRLVKLHNSLLNAKLVRTEAMTALRELGEITMIELSSDSLDVVKMTVRIAMGQIKKGVRPQKNLGDTYSNAIDGARTLDELKKCISKLIKDTSSILTFNLQRTNKGQNGPTHLISYTRASKKCDRPNLRNYVVKWSNRNEICSWRLYDVFSKISPFPIFTVPKVAALDFDGPGIHEDAEWNSNELKDETSAYIKQSFLGIVGKNIHVDDSKLMLMEKVKGSNLIDFAQTKYSYMSADEKSDLFRKMGYLAMLDLLIGNTDRLIQTEYNTKTGEYRLEDLTANLGNLMIDWFPNEDKLPELYAIDNSVKTELVVSKVQKDKYNELVKDLNHRDKMAILSDVIIRSIQKSIQDIAEELTETTNETFQESLDKFKPFLEDLCKSDLVKSSLKNGLEEMSQSFTQEFLPFWDSQKTLQIKKYLKDHHPEFFDAISKRFRMFNVNGSVMQVNPETALIHWLTAIEAHSKEGSFESQKAVLDLSRELPDCSLLPEDVRVTANEIQELAASKNWNPSLSPNSTKLLRKICRDSTCAKKLEFF